MEGGEDVGKLRGLLGLKEGEWPKKDKGGAAKGGAKAEKPEKKVTVDTSKPAEAQGGAAGMDPGCVFMRCS